MTGAERFYARTRMTEARSLMRRTTDFAGSAAAQEVVISLIEDLAEDLAGHADGREEEAFDLIMRSLADVARENAPDAFDRRGFASPFGSVPAAQSEQPCVDPLWKWPVVYHDPGSGTGDPVTGFREYSALKIFGYTVGKTAGWPTSERESFLSDFMESNLPPIIAKSFGEEYGSPSSVVRLRKIACLIAGNANNFFKKDAVRFAAAIDDWESDLAYLKQKYYLDAGLAFLPWPTSRPFLGVAS